MEKTDKTEKTRINLQTFRELYDLYYDSLSNFLGFYTNDPQTIEDIIQEIFFNLWKNRDTLEISYIKTYLFKTAKNKISNHFRDQQRHNMLLEKWYEQQLENIRDKDPFNTDRLMILIQKAIDDLPPKCKDLFLLSKTQNLTYKQIAEIKNISIKTVENQIGIALKKIRQFLAPYDLFLWIYLLFLN